MVTTPSKEAQTAEGDVRAAAGNAIPPNETAAALNGAGDGTPQDPVSGAAPPAAPATPTPERPAPIVQSKFDQRRGDIIANFRANRQQKAVAETDDISDFVQSNGMPADFRAAAGVPAAEPEPEAATPEPAPAATPEPAPVAPQKTTVKVNGRTLDLTHDELIAKAQIALASEDILGEAKALLTEARTTAARPAAPANHGGREATQTEPAPAPAAEPTNQGPSRYKELVEKLQFSDPEEAGAVLAQTIAEETTKAADQVVQTRLVQQRLQDENLRTAKVVQDFRDKHPDIASDENANAVMERQLLNLQMADLRAAGIDPAKVRPDGLPPTPGDITVAHSWYRTIQGVKLMPPETMLEKALEKTLEWRGTKPNEPAPTGNAPPRVEVSVDRTARRQAIQPQPSRTNAPRPTAPQEAVPRTKADIVRNMQASRAKMQGKNLGM